MMIYKRYEAQYESHLHSVSHRVSDCKTFNLKRLANENKKKHRGYPINNYFNYILIS